MLGRVSEQHTAQAATTYQQDPGTLQYCDNSTKKWFTSADETGSSFQEPVSVLHVRSPSSSSSSLSSLHQGTNESGSSISTGINTRLNQNHPGVVQASSSSAQHQHEGMVLGYELRDIQKQIYGGVAPGVSCGRSRSEMSNCFTVLEGSVDFDTKGVGHDQLGQGYALPFHQVKLEWPLQMSNPGNSVYGSSPFQTSYVGGDGFNDRRGMHQMPPEFYPKQGYQGNAVMSSGGMIRESQGVSTEDSMVINAESSSDGGDGGGNGSESARPLPMRGGMDEQWWELPTLMGANPPPMSQLDNSILTGHTEFGMARQPVEDLDSMLIMANVHPPDQQAIMKWHMGDGQAHSQAGLQQQQPPVQQQQRSREDMDAVMFEQDSWSSNQRQLSYQTGGHGESLFNEQISHGHISGDTFSSSLNVSVSPSPSSPVPNSDPNYQHASFSSLPRALSLPSHLRSITLTSPKARDNNAAPSSITTPVGNVEVDGSNSHPFSAPSCYLGAVTGNVDTSAPGDYYARTLLAGICVSGSQLMQESNYGVQRATMGMGEGPQPMQVGQSSSSSMNAFRSTLASSGYYQDPNKEFGQKSLIQRSLSSLPSTDTQQSQQLVKLSPVGSRDFSLQRQRSWNPGRTNPQPRQLMPETRSPKAAGEWKPEIMKNRTGGALSPLSSIAGFNLRRPLQGVLQGGVERKQQEDLKPDTGQTDGGVIPEEGLTVVNLLLRAAEAVDVDNHEMAKAILARLNQHISPTREKSIHRVAHYFREALVARITGPENTTAQLSQDRTLSRQEEFDKIDAYVRFCEVSPYPKFAHFTANQAILEALEGEESMHIVDFQMGAGAQWASFIQDIASLRTLGKVVPTLRLTAVGTRSDEMRATGENLCNFARLMNISLEFQAVVTSPECLDKSMLALRDKEAVAANFVFGLHQLLDGDASSVLTTVLKAVREACPKVVTIVEQEANHNGPFFQQRFSEALQYYTFLFDSLTSSLELGVDSSINSSIEKNLLAPEIMNIVACEGKARVERHERLEQWRVHMLNVGFRPRLLSDASQFQAEKLVSQISARKGFQVSRDQGSLVLGWQGRPLISASSWMC